MRIILILILVSLTAGCSGLADTIRKNQQKQQIYKQYASKYYASCQKEAFNYYPVNIVEKEKPKSLYKPQKTVTCTTFGNTTNCRDTTTDYSGLIEQAKKNANLLTGNTNTYDINARARGSHIKNCIDNNLRSDSSYSRAVSRVNYNSSTERGRTVNKNTKLTNFNGNQNKVNLPLIRSEKVGDSIFCYYGKKELKVKSIFGSCLKSRGFKKHTDTGPVNLTEEIKASEYQLNGYDELRSGVKCYYGRNGQHSKIIDRLPCSRFETF